VLKKELILFEHNPINPFTKKVFKKCPLDTEATMIYATDLQKLIQKGGFGSAKINYTLFFPRFSLFRSFFSIEKFLTSCPLGAQYFIHACKSEDNQK